jgi:SAM-dependent methyltransferase
MNTALHEERLQAVVDVLRLTRVRSVVDLGCGDGALLLRLLDDPDFERLAGVEQSVTALGALRATLALRERPVRLRVTLHEGSMLDARPELAGYDAVTMVETIEHLPPDQLSRWEHAVFTTIRPKATIITTPNSEYNPVLGVPAHRFRHPDHTFEWDRERFRQWVAGVAARHGQRWIVRDIAGVRADIGGASQMGVFLHPDLVI